jgi:hypothetical protein
MRKLKNALFLAGAILSLASFLADYIIVDGLIANPTHANSDAGQTVPYEVKGKVVYITQAEKRKTTAIFIGEIVGLSLLVIYAALFLRGENREERNSQ